jgi:hypothetical protein
MDLRLFHHKHRPNAYYGIMDRRNSRTGSICYYYESVGWYNVNLAMRLLGHYRLFNLCQASQVMSYTGLPPELGYILHYRENNILKNTWVELIPFVKLSPRRSDHPEIKSINSTLLTKRTDILHNFLVAAHVDFEKALLDAIEQIHDPAFLSDSALANVHLEIHQNHQYNTTLAKNEFHVHPEIKEVAAPLSPTSKGKEEGIFSKKQVLLFFDLLARDKKLDPIDLRKPKKFKDIALLLRALTGRGEETWIAELNDYRHKELYAYSTDGERQELIRILINLAKKFRQAGLESIAKLADKKIIELEHAAR